MRSGLLDRVVVPVANEEDTEATCHAIRPHLEAFAEILLVHVVEQTPGYMDHASPTVLEEDARRFLDHARGELGEDVVADVDIRFGRDAAQEIADFADEREATAIAFHPRQKGLLSRLVDPSHESRLIRVSPVPVVGLPPPDEG